jgi:formylglycine-generating enzyme required for sulfatase activity
MNIKQAIINGRIMKSSTTTRQKNKKISYLFFIIGMTVSVSYAQKTYEEILPLRGEDRKFIKIEMIQIKGDTFYRGCNPQTGTTCYLNETGEHRVILNDYYIGKYEVTQELWKSVMKYNKSHHQYQEGFENYLKMRPVENVNWNEIQIFLQKLNELTGKKYRLPTEAEWEYAARGGSRQIIHRYSGGDNIDSVAWWHIPWVIEWTRPIGTKKPNSLGIYDMSGNVAEWCSDWYNETYYQTDTLMVNPQGSQTGDKRVIRGGSCGRTEKYCRITYRFALSPDTTNTVIGFRLVLDKWE